MLPEIDWIENSTPASEDQLASAERHFRHKFPADYREFVTRFAGGEPLRTDFCFDDGGKPFYAGVGIFLNFTEDDDYNLISTAAMTEDFPPDLVPIAEGAGGDYVALDYRTGEVPQVVFWNHERRGQPDEISWVSKTFTEFLELLNEPED
jgi:hypothetical protein